MHANRAKSLFNANRFAHSRTYICICYTTGDNSTVASACGGCGAGEVHPVVMAYMCDRHDEFRGLFGGDRSRGDHVINVYVCVCVFGAPIGSIPGVSVCVCVCKFVPVLCIYYGH